MAILGRALALLLIFGVAAYGVFAYTFLPVGSAVHPDMRPVFAANSVAIHVHVLTAVVAMALGPLQFAASIRTRHPRLHRWSGRIYLGVGVGVGGLAGLYLAQFAHGGMVSRLGFSLLALLWLYTGLRAYLSIRDRAVGEHRKWMIRNFALTLAAVSLRLYVPLSVVTGLEFAVAYPVIAWLCWLPNLLVAEWRYVRA